MQATIAHAAIISENPLKLAVQSSRHHDLNYVVTLLDDGSATCDCPGFRFHSRHIPGFTCRHIVHARATAISTLPTPLRPAPKDTARFEAAYKLLTAPCPGYLRTHPATSVYVERYCCDECEWEMDAEVRA